MKISIRQARIFLAIHETGSVTSAARQLNRAQTSVTKALQNLESSIDTTLFDRSARGVELTPYGTVLLEGATQALAAFRESAKLVPPIKLVQSSIAARLFEMDVSEKWLDAFLALAEHRNLTAAANSLALGTSAVSNSLRKFEECLEIHLFERTANSYIPTRFGEALALHIKLAKNLLRHALDEISSIRGNHTGKVTVGTLPLVRTQILPRAIIALLDEHPDIDVATTESSYPDLMAGLHCGDVDFLLGAMRGITDDESICEEPLFEDVLSIVVRGQHPLAKMKKPSWQELLKYKWVLPRHGTPTRKLFEDAVKAKGENIPEHIVETSSFITLRGLLINSDRITVLSRRQIAYEEASGLLAPLAVELPNTQRSIGITRRRKGTITSAAQLLIEEVKKMVAVGG